MLVSIKIDLFIRSLLCRCDILTSAFLSFEWDYNYVMSLLSLMTPQLSRIDLMSPMYSFENDNDGDNSEDNNEEDEDDEGEDEDSQMDAGEEREEDSSEKSEDDSEVHAQTYNHLALASLLYQSCAFNDYIYIVFMTQFL